MSETLDSYVSSLHTQVAEISKKLNETYSQMKEPPLEVRGLVYETEGLRLMLGDLATSFLQQRFFSPSIKTAVLESLRSCQSAIRSLQSLVTDLEPFASKKAKQKTYGAGLDRKKIEEVEKQVQQAKGTVLIAKCCYDSDIQRQYLSKILTAIPHLARLSHLDDLPTEDDAESHNTDEANDRKRRDREKTHYNPKASRALRKFRRPNLRHQQGYKHLHGIFDVVTANTGTATSTIISVGLPAWLHARRYDIFLSKSYQGWDTSFRTYRTVDFDADVFHYSMAGDVKGLERLFQEKKATPFDIDPDGRTPLHVSDKAANMWEI